MNWTRAQLKSNAKLMVKKNWILCAVVSLIVALFGSSAGGGNTINFHLNDGSGAADSYASNMANNFTGDWVNIVTTLLPFLAGLGIVLILAAVVIQIFVGNALTVGGARFYLHNIHSKGEFNDLAFAFENQFMNVVKVMFMRSLYIFLWTLLLIIPGIIKEYEYRLVPYLLADNPELSVNEALQTSKRMMDGEKWNTFVLDWSFILWDILNGITLGLAGLIWVNPYRDATFAELYTAISERYHARGYDDVIVE